MEKEPTQFFLYTLSQTVAVKWDNSQYFTESESIPIHYKQIIYILNQIKLWTKNVLTITHDIINMSNKAKAMYQNIHVNDTVKI